MVVLNDKIRWRSHTPNSSRGPLGFQSKIPQIFGKEENNLHNQIPIDIVSESITYYQ